MNSSMVRELVGVSSNSVSLGISAEETFVKMLQYRHQGYTTYQMSFNLGCTSIKILGFVCLFVY